MEILAPDRLQDLCRRRLERFVSIHGHACLPLSFDACPVKLGEIISRNLHTGRLARCSEYRSRRHDPGVTEYVDRVIATWTQEYSYWSGLKTHHAPTWHWLGEDLARAAKRFMRQRPRQGSDAFAPEDYVQRACFKILRADYPFDVPLLLWARSILRNTIREPDRSRDVLDVWHYSLDAIDSVTEENFTDADAGSGFADHKAAHRFERVGQQEDLRRDLEQLTPLRRAVIILSFFEELPDSEIAGKLDISMSHLYSTRHRALKQLSRIVEHPAGRDSRDLYRQAYPVRNGFT